jgi:hypothetical protein
MINEVQADPVPDVAKQRLSAAQYDWVDREADLINKAKIQKRSCKTGAAKKPDVFNGLAFYFIHAIALSAVLIFRCTSVLTVAE